MVERDSTGVLSIEASSIVSMGILIFYNALVLVLVKKSVYLGG